MEDFRDRLASVVKQAADAQEERKRLRELALRQISQEVNFDLEKCKSFLESLKVVDLLNQFNSMVLRGSGRITTDSSIKQYAITSQPSSMSDNGGSYLGDEYYATAEHTLSWRDQAQEPRHLHQSGGNTLSVNISSEHYYIKVGAAPSIKWIKSLPHVYYVGMNGQHFKLTTHAFLLNSRIIKSNRDIDGVRSSIERNLIKAAQRLSA